MTFRIFSGCYTLKYPELEYQGWIITVMVNPSIGICRDQKVSPFRSNPVTDVPHLLLRMMEDFYKWRSQRVKSPLRIKISTIVPSCKCTNLRDLAVTACDWDPQSESRRTAGIDSIGLLDSRLSAVPCRSAGSELLRRRRAMHLRRSSQQRQARAAKFSQSTRPQTRIAIARRTVPDFRL